MHITHRPVLEAGFDAFVGPVFSDLVDCVSANLHRLSRPHDQHPASWSGVGNAIGRLRRGEYRLVVWNALQWAPWDPTYMARASARLGLTTAAYVFKSNLLHAAIALSRTPLVVVDLDDSFIIPRHNATWLQRSQVYFKRELAVDHWQAFSGQLHRRSPTKSTRRRSSVAKHLHKLRPISMGRAQAIANVVDSVPLAREKSVDIFFAGQVEGSSTQRLLGIDEFMALAEKGISIDIPEGRISRKEFLFRMSRAHLAWSPSGFGWDCHRHYEAPMVGAVPVIDRPTILRHAPLQDGEHCFFYDPERGGLTRTVLAALAAPERLPAMAMAARDHLLTHHTRRALSREILVAGGMVDLVDTAPGSAVA